MFFRDYPTSLWLFLNEILIPLDSGHPFRCYPKKWPASRRNQWPLCIGMGGRLPSECPAGIVRNTQKQQKNYNYKILKNVNYKKEKAVILEASPKFPQEDDSLYGKIWIRKKDFAILKIEWEQESLRNFEIIEKLAERINAAPIITFISEFGFEKNKIRFPNKYSVEEVYRYLSRGGRRFRMSITTVIYDNYKFFIVDTKVKY